MRRTFPGITVPMLVAAVWAGPCAVALAQDLAAAAVSHGMQRTANSRPDLSCIWNEEVRITERLIPLALPDWELMEYACTDFNKVVEDGLLGPGGKP